MGSMNRLMLTLPADLAEALSRLSTEELRPPKSQALVLISEGLQRRGVLQRTDTGRREPAGKGAPVS